MMSTENLLGEFKEAEHSTPRSLNSSIQVELEKHVSKNIRSACRIAIVWRHLSTCLASNQSPTVLHWAGWLAAA